MDQIIAALHLHVSTVVNSLLARMLTIIILAKIIPDTVTESSILAVLFTVLTKYLMAVHNFYV